MREIDLMFQTMLAELSQRLLDIEQTEWPLSSRIVRQVSRGRRFWYLDDGQKRVYLGPVDDDALSERVESFQESKNAYRARKQLVATLVRQARLPAPDKAVVDVLRHEDLRDAVIVGDLAYLSYSAVLGVRLPRLGRPAVVEFVRGEYLAEDGMRTVLLTDGGLPVVVAAPSRWAVWNREHGDRQRAEAVMEALRMTRRQDDIEEAEEAMV